MTFNILINLIFAHFALALRNAETESSLASDTWADEVRHAMKFVWNNYKSKAWGADEIRPVSGTSKSNWGGHGFSIVDSLSTLYLMGLKQEFKEGVEWVGENLHFGDGHPRGQQSFFETTIRMLGGLVSAYDLSGEPKLLEKAKQLGDVLLHAFPANSVPDTRIDLGNGAASGSEGSCLAEAGSMQLEFRALSRISNDPKYANHADAAQSKLLEAVGEQGISGYLISNGQTWSTRKVGAGADSFYEYLLKAWIQSGGKYDQSKQAWIRFAEKLPDLMKTTKGGLMFVTEGNGLDRMEHLTCFVGGNLILAEMVLGDEASKYGKWGRSLTHTCQETYTRSASGLGPEGVNFILDGEEGKDIQEGSQGYLLRPEVVESVYYAHYQTGDPAYRKWGKSFLDSLNKHAKTNFGYSSVREANVESPPLSDSEETFFMAETLKYLYLLFSPKSTLDLNKWVLNTEAHPLRVHH